MLKRMQDGVEAECTPEEEAEILAQWAANDAQQKATQWLGQRVAEYGTWESQLDEIFHNGIDSWKVRIQSVKDKYPKT